MQTEWIEVATSNGPGTLTNHFVMRKHPVDPTLTWVFDPDFEVFGSITDDDLAEFRAMHGGDVAV